MTTIPDREMRWHPIAVAIAVLYNLDPLLLLAMLDRESEGGDALEPRGAAGLGDEGHGHGLGQIDDRSHQSFLKAYGADGRPLWQKPEFNIHFAAHVLAFYISQFDGSGLDPLLCGMASYNAGPKAVREAVRKMTQPVERQLLIQTLDAVTTDKNYVSDVLARRAGYVFSP